MSELDDPLRQLVAEACSHPPGSRERQKRLTQVIRLTSGKLWRENVPYYGDALQQTWIYFCQNICKTYDASRSSVVTWLNVYLKFRLRDFFNETRDESIRKAAPRIQSARSGEQEGERDVVAEIPAPPDVPPILEAVQTWAETDTDGELRSLHIEGRPDVNAQVVILRRLPPETSWKDLSAEFGIPIPTLSAFYQRKCMPRLRKFGESEGYV